MDRFLNKQLKKEKQILNVFFEFDQEITEELVTRVFILLNKFYPSLAIVRADWNKIDSALKWEDFVIGDYQLISNHDFSIDLKVPMYVQEQSGGEVIIKNLDTIHIYYGLEESTNRNSIGFDFYGNVYTNIRYDWDNAEKVNVLVDQTISANKNRTILDAFLRGLEALLKGEITEFLSPYYLDDKYIYKYGIKEDAKLNYGQEE